MVLEINRKIFIFKTKEVLFSEFPYEIDDYHSVFFRSCKNKVDLPGFEREDFTTLVIDLSSELDKIWENMQKKSCRYEIKRAIREGIQIRLNKDYEEFYEINRLFRKNKKLPGLTDLDLEFMKRFGTLFTAELNSEIICGQLYLEDTNNIIWLIGASKRLEVSKEKAILIGCGNRLMIWEAIQYAKNKGIKEFDMGGYYTRSEKDEQKEKINIFKKSFGGRLITNYNYRKDYSIIFKLAKKINSLIINREGK